MMRDMFGIKKWLCEILRPFRAWVAFCLFSQGYALCYNISPFQG